jgi:MFS family permease
VVLFLQAGNALSWFGYGLILPFEIIYLHQFRGFSTATAGLVLGAILGAGTVATPPSGALLDRFRAKPILIAGNLASALGYAGFAFVDRPWQAFACAVIGGAGVGVTRTANQTLLITLITPEQRVASFALGRAAQNLGLGLDAALRRVDACTAPLITQAHLQCRSSSGARRPRQSRANAAAASIAKSRNGSRLMSTTAFTIVPPANAHGESPG